MSGYPVCEECSLPDGHEGPHSVEPSRAVWQRGYDLGRARGYADGQLAAMRDALVAVARLLREEA
jgi:5-formyltetrahydrofolate cyclo-ligase